MGKKLNIIFIVVCCGIVGAVVGGSLLADNKYSSQLENRTLSTSPAYSFDSLISGDYFNSLENYYIDQIIDRETFVDILNTSKVIKGQTKINNTILCNNNILLRDSYIEDIFDFLSNDRSKEVADAISKIKSSTDKYNGRTIYINVMDQTEFYRNYIPGYYYDNLDEVYEEYNEALINDVNETGASVINCNPILLEHFDEYIYYKTDHHWTTKGAYYATELLFEEISDDGYNISLSDWRDMNISVSDKPFYGSMTIDIGSDYFSDEDRLIYAEPNNMPEYTRITNGEVNGTEIFDDSSSVVNTQNIGQGNYSLDCYYTDRENMKNILVIGYSYKRQMISYLVANFNETVFLDPRSFDGSICEYIEENQPDYVVVLRDDLWEGNSSNICTID